MPPQVQEVPVSSRIVAPRLRRFRPGVWLIFIAFVAVAIGLQIVRGAYRAELSSYPDESAQAVAGIAVERYMAHNLGRSPLGYMRNYYLHYPKVAIGHWPPLLYIAEAGAMLVLSPSKYALLGLQALFAGILACLLLRELKPLVGYPAAVLGSLALLLNPLIRRFSSMTMAELPLTIAMFLACLSFGRFAESRRTRDAIWFAVWTAAAVLTKGTGWVIPLVALAVVLVIRDWKLPLESALRPAALIVAVCCIPWQIVTMKSVVNGWYDSPTFALVARLAARYAVYLFTVPGIAMGVAGVASGFYLLRRTWKTGRSQAYWASLACLVAVSCLFNVMVPTSEEPRKIIMIVPPIFVLAAAGTRALARRVSPLRQQVTAAALFAVLAVLNIALSLPLHVKPRLGYDRVAADLVAAMPAGSAALVVSDAWGEGALIGEFALRRPDPTVYLVRGSKLLASQMWDATKYRNRVHSGDECARLLASLPVSYLVVDRRKAIYHEDYFRFVEQMLRIHSADWQLTAAYPSPADSSNAIALYRRASGVAPVRNLPAWIAPQIPGSE